MQGMGVRESVRPLRSRTLATPIRLAVALFVLAQACPTHAEEATTGPSDTQAPESKKCDTLQRRIVKEQSSLVTFEDTLAKDRKGRESCSTKPMCARYDQAIKAMEARKEQHEQRLAKFKSDAEEACKPS